MKHSLRIFKALSDETRLRIVEFLLGGERCVCEIIPYTKRAQSTVSLQLAKLESLGILKSRRDGKKIFYRIASNKVKKILECMEDED
ncbi:MAG: winged helix-turn-helix transcriptional regulator [Candidatus Altiarchaeota archaeon]|nr:winged helix-turn-helix transcriptional regulator [Candidatus Altiarchaeota archaeon]